MSTIPAVYEHGIFRPTVPVHLPEGTKVNISTVEVAPTASDEQDDGTTAVELTDDMKQIYAILGERYSSGHTETAARHNEHQP